MRGGGFGERLKKVLDWVRGTKERRLGNASGWGPIGFEKEINLRPEKRDQEKKGGRKQGVCV